MHRTAGIGELEIVFTILLISIGSVALFQTLGAVIATHRSLGRQCISRHPCDLTCTADSEFSSIISCSTTAGSGSWITMSKSYEPEHAQN